MSLLLLLAALQAATPAAPPLAVASPPAAPATRWPVREADFVIPDFPFASGERLPELRIHYSTLGQPHRDARGEIDNAVMVLHGTGGSGRQFLAPQFADELYGPGQPLDIRRYWIILPDGIGHGGSSKPSDGLRMRFPRYDYADMVAAQYRLLHDGLGIRRMRLIMGTSMGCMHSLMWGEDHPDFARALMPLACEPVPIAGLNRMWRQLVIDGIKADPAWAGGEYRQQPLQGLRTAQTALFIAGAAPLNLQATYADRDAAAAFARDRVAAALARLDANDLIYQVDASRTYDPSARLAAITAPLVWINSADDFINPRNLDYPARAVRQMRDARFRLIEESADTRGHGTHTWAVNWKADLAELLARTQAAR
ncbi:alpha/beta fold hydrolase [Sphingomonas corticis]|jgi:homoserine O-acetyltransferase|uniref:Alpha/beta fold hydrolase n=1 Tax=Sphingomonas corticis TaxID=2722791 RepID=A0ABX1CVM6_9SPHN|nr:alpha/beta fold hydrolase [Sphingomonas corticis]NJR79952.1 alpha/beta fold hydrolase [Sphingomonas corticis]